MTVLKTRLCRPVVNKMHLLRTHLLTTLASKSHKSIFLLIAGAGFGKSILASQYLESIRKPYCWISMGEEFNDINIALEYLITSIQDVYPSSMQNASGLLTSPILPSSKMISNHLLNDLAEIEGELIISIDNYHYIQNKELHLIFETLILNLPSQVKMILISRYDPPFKLARLVAYEKLFELRMVDLMFKVEEIIQLAKTVDKLALTESTASRIEKETEGWAVAIRMYLKDIAQNVDSKSSILIGENRKKQLAHYMLADLLEAQPRNIQKLLVAVSLFSKFNLELFSRLFPDHFNEVQISSYLSELKEIIDAALFILPLDEEADWYHYHPLVIQMLHQKIDTYLSCEEKLAICRKGSVFFKAELCYDEALQCAVMAEDISFAIQIINEHKDDLLYYGKLEVLERWVNYLPQTNIESDVDILIIKAIIHDAYAEYNEAMIVLNTALRHLVQSGDQNASNRLQWGEYYSIKSYIIYKKGSIQETIEDADKALSLLEGQHTFLRDLAVKSKGIGLHMTGHPEEANEVFQQFLDQLAPQEELTLMRIHSFYAVLHIYQADLYALKHSVQIVYDLSLKYNNHFAKVMANCLIANTNYLQNNLTEVIKYADAISDFWNIGRPLWVAHSIFAKVLCQLSLDKPLEAEQTLEKLTSFIYSFDKVEFKKLACAFQTEVALRRGDIARANALAENADFDILPLIFTFYFSKLTHVKLLIMSGGHQDMQEAHRLLQEYCKFGEQTNNQNFLIQAYSLFAYLHKKQNQLDKAEAFLMKSINLACQSEYIRPYLDLGADMEFLIHHLREVKPTDQFIKKIYNAFRSTENLRSPQLIPSKTYMNKFDLTPKEIKLLELSSKGYQNKEIADELCYSLGTVKTYLYHIYQKIGAKNRSHAIRIIRENAATA